MRRYLHEVDGTMKRRAPGYELKCSLCSEPFSAFFGDRLSCPACRATLYVKTQQRQDDDGLLTAFPEAVATATVKR